MQSPNKSHLSSIVLSLLIWEPSLSYFYQPTVCGAKIYWSKYAILRPQNCPITRHKRHASAPDINSQIKLFNKNCTILEDAQCRSISLAPNFLLLKAKQVLCILHLFLFEWLSNIFKLSRFVQQSLILKLLDICLRYFLIIKKVVRRDWQPCLTVPVVLLL